MNAGSSLKYEIIKKPQITSLLIILLFIVSLAGCSRSSEETPVMPPITNPLAREYIGYGVVNVSFTHLLNEPGVSELSRGYLRRGSVVRILERRPLIKGTNSESWVLVEGNYLSSTGTQNPGTIMPGWLQETTVEVYDNESRAITASKNMNLQ